jgi:hypothetical protein
VVRALPRRRELTHATPHVRASPSRASPRHPPRSVGRARRAGRITVRRVDVARLPRRGRVRGRGHRLGAGTLCPVSGRSPRRARARVRQDEQRGGVRLRLELGRREPPDRRSILSEARSRGSLHTCDRWTRALGEWSRPRRGHFRDGRGDEEVDGRGRDPRRPRALPIKRRIGALDLRGLRPALRGPVPLAPQRGGDVRRVPRALHFEAPEPDSS